MEMKELIYEVRMYLAELLLTWATDIAPDYSDGTSIHTTVFSYFLRKSKFKEDNETQNRKQKT